MSVASEITRIQNAKSALKTSIENKGVTVSDSTLLSGYSALVDQIETGGGSSADLKDLIERTITSFDIPNNVTKIGTSIFQDCTALTSIVIPSGVTEIDSRAFFNCYNLTSVTLPDTLIMIDSDAFCACTSIQNIILKENLTTLGIGAFNGSGLIGITIPNTVTSIGYDCFGFCSNLTEVVMTSTIPPTLSTDVFEYTSNNLTIYVPDEAIEDYKAATNWSEYASIIKGISEKE